MKKIKKLQRWPKNYELLCKKLTFVCKQIDEILTPKTPVDVLNTTKGKEFYKTEFTKLFLQTGYYIDTKPQIFFRNQYGGLCSGSGIIITVYLRDRDRTLIQIKL